MHIVILAGGEGSRLWPLSRKDCPKQFLHLGGQDSLIKQTVDRFAGSPLVQGIIVSTNEAFEPLVRQELEGLNIPILVEPCRRNTGPAIGLAIRYLEEVCHVGPSDPVLILPSDHLIDPVEVFLDYLAHGLAIAKMGHIVAFGIRPSKPETGYGYIRIREKLGPFAYRVDRFVEKPNLASALEYVADDRYYWNSGMFLFTTEVFWAESEKYYPQICEPLDFEKLDNISIDYALMEKSEKMAVCPMPVYWSDVGSWEHVYDMMDKDKNQNVKLGNVVDIDTKNCLIFGGKKVISTLGLEDLVIVDTEDGILIAKKSDSQRVRELSGKWTS